MADVRVTTMVVKVDLKCEKCKEKIKKVLCKIPREIENQMYDEQNNAVIITVVCCSPKKIKQKIQEKHEVKAKENGKPTDEPGTTKPHTNRLLLTQFRHTHKGIVVGNVTGVMGGDHVIMPR